MKSNRTALLIIHIGGQVPHARARQFWILSPRALVILFCISTLFPSRRSWQNMEVLIVGQSQLSVSVSKNVNKLSLFFLRRANKLADAKCTSFFSDTFNVLFLWLFRELFVFISLILYLFLCSPFAKPSWVNIYLEMISKKMKLAIKQWK